ncbi:MAG: UvrD-helicase domain-containing protein [Bacteriovoracaceae bacterium]|nr:UvrD-helicase domain-containing protein [Bacteriovoracaceae bacterium]
MIMLDELNAQQRLAAKKIDGPLLILAGAGSGKTKTIIYRMAHMIRNLGIPASSILGVSFTNKASKEMRERMHALMGRRVGRDLTLCTFHSLCVQILRQDIDSIGRRKNFTIFDTSDQLSVLRRALKHFNAGKGFDRKTVISKIEKLKNLGIGENEFADSIYFDPEDPYDHATEYCYRYYQENLEFYNAIDFNDIILLAVQILKKNPQIATKYSKRFQYIMIDEYQDTNPLQFQLVQFLTSTHNNICVVGDDDQSIYAFRGADIGNILSFERQFKGATIIKLEQNYRSTAPILNLANAVIKENKKRTSKTLWTQKKSNKLPILWAMGDTEHEADVVAEEIAKMQMSGVHLSNVAMLYRSNTQTPPLEDALRLSSIPYKIIGGQKFYDKKEIKDLISYLSLILNPRNEVALRRIINVPNRGIGKTTLNKFLDKSKSEGMTLFKTMQNFPQVAGSRANLISSFVEIISVNSKNFKMMSLREAIGALIEQIDYLKYIEKEYSDTPKQIEGRKGDVYNFLEAATRFQNYMKEETSLKNFVEKLLLQDSQDSNDDGDDDGAGDGAGDGEGVNSKNEVSLMTLHSSKGLEFNTVFLIGVEEESLPHKRTIEQGEDISEERRLCYVGMTRAREELIMTYCKERTMYGKKVPRHRSRFLHSLKDSKLFVEQDRTTFGHLSEEEAEEYKDNFFASLIDSL